MDAFDTHVARILELIDANGSAEWTKSRVSRELEQLEKAVKEDRMGREPGTLCRTCGQGVTS